GDVREHRRPDIITLVEAGWASGTARNERRALLDTLLDEGLDFLILNPAHNGTDDGSSRAGIAGHGLFCGCLGDGRRLVHARERHEQARGRIARLPGIVEAVRGAAADGLLK